MRSDEDVEPGDDVDTWVSQSVLFLVLYGLKSLSPDLVGMFKSDAGVRGPGWMD